MPRELWDLPENQLYKLHQRPLQGKLMSDKAFTEHIIQKNKKELDELANSPGFKSLQEALGDDEGVESFLEDVIKEDGKYSKWESSVLEKFNYESNPDSGVEEDSENDWEVVRRGTRRGETPFRAAVPMYAGDDESIETVFDGKKYKVEFQVTYSYWARGRMDENDDPRRWGVKINKITQV